MAISVVGSSAWQILTATGTHTLPSSADGDRLLLRVFYKDQAVTCTVSDWTEDKSFADGVVASGNGTGSMRVKVFRLDRGASAPSNPSVALGAGTILAAVSCIVLRKAASESWSTAIYVDSSHAFTTSATPENANQTASVPNGGCVLDVIAVRDDSTTFTRPTTGIDDSGGLVTWNGNYVEGPATHANTTTGNDLSGDGGYRLVTTGAAGVTLRATATLSAAETGSVVWIVQGVTVTGTTVTPTTASLTTATFVPTVSATAHQTVTPTTANLATATFAPTVTASNHQSVTPGVASLTTSTFAPTVLIEAGGVTVTPSTASLALATFAPTIAITDHKTVMPPAVALALSGFAPTVSTTAHQTLIPSTAALSLVAYEPTVTGDVPTGLEANPVSAIYRRR